MTRLIPKVIHYCWFGRNPKSELIQKCIASWKEYCPDYKIIEWNEDNFDVDFCQYTKDAYNERKWAFVSDVARIKIVAEYGGIYLDTDVELHTSLDPLLSYEAWFAQDDIRYINTGLGFGAIKGHQLLLDILDKRIERAFDQTICNAIDTPIIRKSLGMKQRRESQLLDNVYIVGMLEYHKYGTHYEGNSWKDKNAHEFSSSRRNKYWKLKCFLRNPEVINWLERNGETIISKLYVFMAYDFLDCGPLYFAKRLWLKLTKRS